MELLNCDIYCPYCGENIALSIDNSVAEQDYYEDCSVCCRPIRIVQSIDVEGQRQLRILRDDE